MAIIKEMAKENNQTIVMVTHDYRLAGYADKIIHILDGDIQKIEKVEKEENTIVQQADAGDDTKTTDGDTQGIREGEEKKV